MIQIQGLCKQYNGRPVLTGLNMQVRKGQVYGLIGRNGAGKSTTMNILCGLLKRDAGQVLIDGKDPGSGRVPVGYLPESPALYEYMNSREYLTYIAAAAGYEGDRKKRAEEVLALVGLTDAAGRKIKGYSRGMKQRVGMAAALYSGHELIVLDEPTSALDPQGRMEVMNIIQTMRQMGKTVLLSTHILSDVERVADRVGILHQGQIALEGTVEELTQAYAQPLITFELEAPDPGLLEALNSQPFCQNAQQNGPFYYVWYQGAKEDANRALLRFLGERGVLVGRYQTHRATLEQCYLKVVGQA